MTSWLREHVEFDDGFSFREFARQLNCRIGTHLLILMADADPSVMIGELVRVIFQRLLPFPGELVLSSSSLDIN